MSWITEKIKNWRYLRQMERMMKNAVKTTVPVVMRPLEGLPTIIEDPEIIHKWYYESAEFVPVARYGRETKILDREIGYLAIMKGFTLLPIVRVLIRKKPENTSGKKGFVEGT